MEFGHIEGEISDIDFTLAPDAARNKRVLEAANDSSQLQVFVGASKWGEKSWVGKIYPRGTADKAFLPVYAKNFNTVEFGPTFYNIPTPESTMRWLYEVAGAPEFKFCPKFPQNITHIRRLANAEEQTAKFYECLSGFGSHLGSLLLQLGETFSPKSFPQLKAYLAALPTSVKVHVEVRNKNWYAVEEHRNDFFQLLEDSNVGTVISDTAGRRDCVHMELTTNEVMIRFGGNDLAASDYTRMDAWVERLKVWQGQGLKTVWFFMHQYHEGYVPEACDYLIRRMNEQLGTNLARPKMINNTLF